MAAGRTHQRLQQYYKGVPVVGADVTRQLDGGVPVSVFGTVHAGIRLDAVPVLGAGEAGRVAAAATGGRMSPEHSPDLVILPLDDGRYALAWRAAADVRACFVDAASGRVLLDYSTLKAEQVDGVPADAAPVDTRAAIDATRRYFLQRTGRFVLDESAEPVRVVVHPASAFSRDSVVRELAHAVVDRTAALIYRRESGALADAWADIVATSVAAASKSAEDGGRDLYLVSGDATAGGLRSLRDPARHGNPDHYSGVSATATVRANSTVASHAFYLAVEGGVNRTSGLAVEGVGPSRREQVETAFSRAFAYMLPSAAGFGTAREATIQSARDLYGPESDAARAIAEAWAAVGVR
jgi:Zn-dependent metalloprotease